MEQTITGSFALKKGLAQQLKGGVIMDVVTPEHARIAEDAGACAVMALERVPADIRANGGVARMSDPAQVVRAFDSGDIIHVHETVDPVRDIGIINAELIIADLDTVSKRIVTTEHKAKNDKDARAQLPHLQHIATALQEGKLVSQLEFSDEDKGFISELSLLTAKKFIYVINVSDAQLVENWTPSKELIEAMGGSEYVIMCNKLELELSEMSHEEKTTFLKELGLPESGLDRLIKEAYHTLGLLSFLTTGPDETRAWTCHIGDLAPRASRAIHTDFERLFIRAEVINWQDLLDCGGYGPARAKGHLHTVGKDYVMKDGDVVEILIGK